MTDFPLVSVVIPTYNRAELLKRSIRSVLNQTYEHVEIIVVDDHSTDDTRERVREMQKGSGKIDLHYVVNPGNGNALARNYGIETSNGEYTLFLDDDDEILPDRIKLLVAGWNEGISAVSSGVHLIRPDRRIKFIPPAEIDLEDIKNGYRIAGLFMTRRAYLESVGGWDEALTACQDLDLYWRLAERYGPIHIVQKVLANIYQDRGDRISNSGVTKGRGYYEFYLKVKDHLNRKQRAYLLYSAMKARGRTIPYDLILKWVPARFWKSELAQKLKRGRE